MSAAVVEKVMAVVQETGYRRNAAARGLRGAGQAIAVVCQHIGGHFTSQLLYGMGDALEGCDEILLTVFPRSVEAYRKHVISLLEQPMVKGVVLVAPPLPFYETEPLQSHKPMLICQGSSEEHGAWDLPSFRCEPERCFHEIFSKGLAMGWSKLLYLHRRIINDDDIFRLRTIQALAQEFSIEVVVRDCMGEQVGEILDASEEGTLDAIVCSTDSLALACYGHLSRSSIDMPSIVGIDGSETMEMLGLPSISMPLNHLGRTCVAQILNQEMSDLSLDCNVLRF